MGGGYKKYDTVNVNGRNRVRFVKANSKSKNPIVYIKSDKEYITYKSFLRKRKVKGGVNYVEENVDRGGVRINVNNLTFNELHQILNDLDKKDIKTYLIRLIPLENNENLATREYSYVEIQNLIEVKQDMNVLKTIQDLNKNNYNIVNVFLRYYKRDGYVVPPPALHKFNEDYYDSYNILFK
jgi:hypothetical protein